MRIFITGIGGFIGYHLTARILAETDWQVAGIDLCGRRLASMARHPRLAFSEVDMMSPQAALDRRVAEADVVIPLAAIATPATYVRDPLRVFELGFEANLTLVRRVVAHEKRLVFPSTSEVYGFAEPPFDETSSPLVYGPIHRERWIYAASKQLLERIIWAHGARDELDFTLFRPFNFVGPGLDGPAQAAAGVARVVPQMVYDALAGRPLRLVDGGAQRRCFTDIEDGIDALMKIVGSAGPACRGQIFNIGNPAGECSMRELAALVLDVTGARVPVVDVPGRLFYGDGYQDIDRRVPSIDRIGAALGWAPRRNLRSMVERVVHAAQRDTERATDGERRPEADSMAVRSGPSK